MDSSDDCRSKKAAQTKATAPLPSHKSIFLSITGRPEGAELTAEDVVAHCKAELTGYKVPRRITFLDELPKSNVGKILRRELRES